MGKDRRKIHNTNESSCLVLSKYFSEKSDWLHVFTLTLPNFHAHLWVCTHTSEFARTSKRLYTHCVCTHIFAFARTSLFARTLLRLHAHRCVCTHIVAFARTSLRVYLSKCCCCPSPKHKRTRICQRFSSRSLGVDGVETQWNEKIVERVVVVVVVAVGSFCGAILSRKVLPVVKDYFPIGYAKTASNPSETEWSLKELLLVLLEVSAKLSETTEADMREKRHKSTIIQNWVGNGRKKNVKPALLFGKQCKLYTVEDGLEQWI